MTLPKTMHKPTSMEQTPEENFFYILPAESDDTAPEYLENLLSPEKLPCFHTFILHIQNEDKGS